MATNDTKLTLALQMLDDCCGRHGVWASADGRYGHQCWTRDFGLATLPLFLANGRHDVVARHLASLEARQRPDGRIPILFLDGLWGTARFVTNRLVRSARSRSLSFMLRRWLQGELWDLTPGTRDSELYYCLAALETEHAVGRRVVSQSSVSRALAYVENELVVDGLVRGCDWRDTMHLELANKALLTNNSVLVRVYDLIGAVDKASALRRTVRNRFWYGGVLRDYPGAMPVAGRPAFDPLGASLAVLHDVVSPDEYEAVLGGFRAVDSPCGVTIMCKHNPLDDMEREVIERTQGVVVWPFVVGFSILAMRHMALHACAATTRDACTVMASKQSSKLEALDGFYEWYDPATAIGCGSAQQLWSAVLYARTRLSSGT